MKKNILSVVGVLVLTGCNAPSNSSTEPETTEAFAEIVDGETDERVINEPETITDWLTKSDNYIMMYNYASPQIYDFYDVEFVRLKPIDDSYLAYTEYKDMLNEAAYTQDKVFAISNRRHKWDNNDISWHDLSADDYGKDNKWDSSLAFIYDDDKDNRKLSYYYGTISQSPSQDNYDVESAKMFLLNRDFSMTYIIDYSGCDDLSSADHLPISIHSTWEDESVQYGEGLIIKAESPLISQDNPFAIGKVTVNTDNVNMRYVGRINSNIVGTAENGKTYDVYDILHERDQSYTWYQIGEHEWIADGDWCQFVPVSYLPTSDTVLE